jgi:hypothetical protein
MSYRFVELNECVRAVNDRLSDLKLEVRCLNIKERNS